MNYFKVYKVNQGKVVALLYAARSAGNWSKAQHEIVTIKT